MIICSCNALSDKDVDKAVQGGVCRVSQIYAAQKCRVKCGQCVPNVACRLKEALQAHSQEPEQAGRVSSSISCVSKVSPMQNDLVLIEYAPHQQKRGDCHGMTAASFYR